MDALVLPPEARYKRVREAREAFLHEGAAPGEVLSLGKWVTRSWERCRSKGLEGDSLPEGLAVVSAEKLREARERSSFLLSQSRGLLAHLYEQIRSTGSVVVLSDNSGLLLESIGDADFVDRAIRVALQPGACWDEARRGTNAVGTALADQMPVEVVGSEHFYDCNGILTCSAAPIFDAHDRLIGVLDISGDYRSYQRHTLGLVRMTTSLLERRLFEAEYAQHILVSVHSELEYVGTLQEGLLAFSSEGQLLACNRDALQMLGLNRNQVLRLDFGMIFDAGFETFMDRAGSEAYTLVAVPVRGGGRVYARVCLPAAIRAMVSGRPNPGSERRASAPPSGGQGAPAPAAVATPQHCRDGEPSFACLDTGDGQLGLAIARARRIVGRDIPLLILGESGVGKEMFAKAYHRAGPRSDAPFIALNCAAIPENLIESELFGYVGGAFTGARREGSIGKIQQASGGTLFLDEIGDMPLALQARLLRVLQERSVTPLGGTRAIQVNIALVCATHRNLPEAVREGSFRQDLYYRVNGLTVKLPPLRERSDIRRIVENILEIEAVGRAPVRIAPDVLEFFVRYPWPGNIRQLHNVLRVAVALLDEGENLITSTHLPEELFAMEGDSELQATVGKVASKSTMAAPGESLEAIECRAIEQVLAEEGGNVSRAARRLGISRNTLYRKLGRF